jgi:hypothetical protein
MKIRNKITPLLVSAAAFTLAVGCKAAPSTTFYPAASTASQRLEPKSSADSIQILSSAPTDNVIILGEISVEGGAGSSLHELMAAALGEAQSKGADFVALAGSDAQSGLVIGKMVPAGHGRSMFVAAPVLGSEVGRIAAVPAETTGSIRVVLGRYAR